MKAIILRCDLFNAPGMKRYSERFLLHFLEAGCRANLDYLRMFPLTAPLYKSGVTYQMESMRELRPYDVPRIEDWYDIPTLYAVGHGDCEDLTMARVAELRIKGIKAEPFLKYQNIPGLGVMYHVLVKLKNGKFDDPSKILGMGRHDQ